MGGCLDGGEHDAVSDAVGKDRVPADEPASRESDDWLWRDAIEGRPTLRCRGHSKGQKDGPWRMVPVAFANSID